jgi:hypothetical protein
MFTATGNLCILHEKLLLCYCQLHCREHHRHGALESLNLCQ